MGGQTAGLKIGILSTPSVFLHLRDQKAPFFDDCINFEFDRRFDVFGHQFEFFDFRDGSAVKVRQRSCATPWQTLPTSFTFVHRTAVLGEVRELL